MWEFLRHNIHWVLLFILFVLFIVSNIITRKELPFKQAKARIVAMAITMTKIDGSRILGDVEDEFMSFMDRHCDEFLKLLKSMNLISLRENINIDDLSKIGKLFADFKLKIERKAAAT